MEWSEAGGVRTLQFLAIVAVVAVAAAIIYITETRHRPAVAESHPTTYRVGKQVAHDFWLADGTRCIAWSQGGIACEFSGWDPGYETETMGPPEPEEGTR